MRGFVDDEGQTVFLKDLDPANWETKDHGSFVEILLLAPPDGGFGREVMNSYVLHDRVSRVRLVDPLRWCASGEYPQLFVEFWGRKFKWKSAGL